MAHVKLPAWCPWMQNKGEKSIRSYWSWHKGPSAPQSWGVTEAAAAGSSYPAQAYRPRVEIGIRKTQKLRGWPQEVETLTSEEEVQLDQHWSLWPWRKDPVGGGSTSLRGDASASWLAVISKALQTLEQPHVCLAAATGRSCCCWSEVLLWWYWQSLLPPPTKQVPCSVKPNKESRNAVGRVSVPAAQSRT